MIGSVAPTFAAVDQRAVYPLTWLARLPFPLRSVLRRSRGMLGMMVGVGLSLGIVMTLLAVSQAGVRLYTGEYLLSGADLYVVTHGGMHIPILPGEGPGTITHAREILSEVRRLPGVSTAIGVMNWSLERQPEGPRRRDEPAELIASMGVDGDPTLIPNVVTLKTGRWLRRSDEVVVGDKLSREKGIGLDRTLRLAGRYFRVVGVGKLRGFGFSGDSIAYLDYRAFRERADVGDLVGIIAVDTTQPAETRQRILELGSLSVADPPELVKQAEAANSSGVALRLIFGGLALCTAGLFVSSMLSRSIVERRLQFATLRAIGIPRRSILLTVGLEAVLVSVAGSLFGVAVSLSLGALINGYVAPSYGLESLYIADLGLFGLVFGLALGLGLLAGLAPARQATGVDPVEVLREA
jgi:putative ABC transport system permease protein